MKAASPYLTVEEAADHLRFPSVKAFHEFLRRRRIAGRPVKAHHRGRALLFKAADLDAALDVEQSFASRARRSA